MMEVLHGQVPIPDEVAEVPEPLPEGAVVAEHLNSVDLGGPLHNRPQGGQDVRVEVIDPQVELGQLWSQNVTKMSKESILSYIS